MTTALTLGLLLATAADDPSPGQLYIDMVNRYKFAGHVSGKIVSLLSDGKDSEEITNRFQISHPNRFMLEVTMKSVPNLKQMAVSNGKGFVYPSPNSYAERREDLRYVIEPVERRDGRLMDVREMYGIARAVTSGVSIPQDIVFGRDLDLEMISKTVQNLRYDGTREYNGEKVHVLRCTLVRPEVGMSSALAGAFFVSEKFDLRYAKFVEKIMVKNESRVASLEYFVDVHVDDETKINGMLYDISKFGKGKTSRVNLHF